jgi:chromosome segregation ATPase
MPSNLQLAYETIEIRDAEIVGLQSELEELQALVCSQEEQINTLSERISELESELQDTCAQLEELEIDAK